MTPEREKEIREWSMFASIMQSSGSREVADCLTEIDSLRAEQESLVEDWKSANDALRAEVAWLIQRLDAANEPRAK